MRALVCYNPKSGKQKLLKNIEYVTTELHKKYETVDVYETVGPQSLISHLKENAKNYDLVLISGGDGTLNEAATGIIEGGATNTAISYIPAGTCNDVGSMLHLKKNVKKALKNTLNGEIVSMDVCKADEKYFVYVFGAGKFIDISYATPHKLKKRLGKAAYFIYGAKELATRQKYHLKFTFDDKCIEGDYYLFLALNSDHVSGFHIRRSNHVKLNDGLFNLTLIKNKGIASWPRLVNFVLFGEKTIFKYGVDHYCVSSVKIEADKPIDFTVDGEYAFQKQTVKLDIIKEAVKIVVPAKIKQNYFMNSD